MTFSAKPTSDVLQEINRASAGMIEKLFRDRHMASGTPDVAALMRVLATADPGQLAKLRALEESFYRDHFVLWSQLATPAEGGAMPVTQEDGTV